MKFKILSVFVLLSIASGCNMPNTDEVKTGYNMPNCVDLSSGQLVITGEIKGGSTTLNKDDGAKLYAISSLTG